jgi:hypothetical protein
MVLGGCQTGPQGAVRPLLGGVEPVTGPGDRRITRMWVRQQSGVATCRYRPEAWGVVAFRAQAGSASVEHVDARPAVAGQHRGPVMGHDGGHGGVDPRVSRTGPDHPDGHRGRNAFARWCAPIRWWTLAPLGGPSADSPATDVPAPSVPARPAPARAQPGGLGPAAGAVRLAGGRSPVGKYRRPTSPSRRFARSAAPFGRR